jgi:hypothetical protein
LGPVVATLGLGLADELEPVTDELLTTGLLTGSVVLPAPSLVHPASSPTIRAIGATRRNRTSAV